MIREPRRYFTTLCARKEKVNSFLTFMGAVLVVMSGVSCTLTASIESLSQGSTGTESFFSLSLNNKPASYDSRDTVAVEVSGNGLQAYLYKIGLAAATDCSDSSGYSLAPISISQAINEDLTAYAENTVRLCVVGIDQSFHQQSFEDATQVDWYTDLTPAVVGIAEHEQAVVENDGLSHTLTLTSTASKPYPITVTYQLTGNAVAGTDHSLQTTGTMTLPAGATSASLPVQALRNAGSTNNSYFQMRLVSTDRTMGHIDESKISRFLISDVDAAPRPTVTSYSTGATSVCAILSDGQLKCWGNNDYGQVGNGSTTTHPAPVTIDPGVSYSMVSVGTVTCGITSLGVLKCWGNNTNGQVGDGSTTHRSTPTVIDSGVSYAFVEVGGATVCGLTTGHLLKCWGANSYGQVGVNSTADILTPSLVDSGLLYSHVSVKGTATCGITQASQTLKCWGYNLNGQVGNASTTDQLVPVAIDSGNTYSSVVGSTNTTCALTTGGVLKCWGANG
ncbi:MAG: hypothetical protein AAGB31_07670, partial [Bdellovibrio sp.]